MDSRTKKRDDTPMDPAARNDNATWSFVQMNMTLLPIARPLPVSVGHKFHEGAALAGVKPCTPTQKLHHRLRQKTSNISPRRHDVDYNNSWSDSEYASDPAKRTPSGYSPLHRSSSLSSGCAARGVYKGKKILELQDEDRRLHPDDRVTAPSPSKRGKHQP
ncbi:uncharacterized protein PITG_00698 [Phytophthora infestans T30-4]|uniref:Uncharacterized protein n=1 Tax=Phytophthora infestans (strain T30-4) TaxID=403677 RepID=D0MRG7_PHYIT|nr:uncharacterized protein PITG_00698 [Phytophthora infestans T30-4]EEY58086.1 conserved hypothetical protein [Phytophthora infestans T30-4]|eukprot:XP_002909272.1 conserved hypothetical protein [Phytophthora infestans T30-4]